MSFLDPSFHREGVPDAHIFTEEGLSTFLVVDSCAIMWQCLYLALWERAC